MDCKEFQDSLYDMSSSPLDGEMKEHLSQCRECAERYAAFELLKPKAFPETPESLKRKIMAKAAEKKKKHIRGTGKTWYAAAVVVIAATLTLTVIFAKPDRAAAAVSLLDRSIANTEGLESMIVRLDVRTLAEENFSYIGLDDEMVPHTLTVVMGDPYLWRLEKGGRVILCDGNAKYMWFPARNYGYAGSPNSNFEEWFSLLIDPATILYKEKEAASRYKGMKYWISEEGDHLLMTVHAEAMGDFTNNYMLNTSIEESDTRREYIFDRDTKLLKGLKIYVLDGDDEILAVDITDIEYNAPVEVKALAALPAGCEWRDMTRAPAAGILSGISARDAAKLLFASLGRGELDDTAKELLYSYDTDLILKVYGGAKLKALGKPFTSGLYAGVFVPVRITLPNGKERRLKLALRNDNPNKVWLVDGGL